jgi:hypothetical protein
MCERDIARQPALTTRHVTVAGSRVKRHDLILESKPKSEVKAASSTAQRNSSRRSGRLAAAGKAQHRLLVNRLSAPTGHSGFLLKWRKTVTTPHESKRHKNKDKPTKRPLES